jgi:hypothetical protein
MRPHPARASHTSTQYAVAVALLALGFAVLVRGAAHPGVAYRPWAFDHHAYSDLLAMAGDRYFHGGRPLPYVEDRVEYPPLLAAALWLPSFVSRSPWGYFAIGYGALAALALASIALLRRLPGASPWWFAGSPALAYYTGLNWDQLPIALLLAALVAWERGHPARAGAWAGLGASAKLFPVALAPGVLGAAAARRAGRALGLAAGAFAAAIAAVNLPVAWAAPGAWRWFWSFNAARGAENSVWEVLRRVPSLEHLARDAAFLNAATAGMLAAVAAAAALGAWRSDGSARAVRLALGLVLVAWIATNKVYSPQYALYAVLAGALAAAPATLGVLVSAIAVVDYHVAFEARASRGLVRTLDAVYAGEELLRTAIFLALAAWIGRELWRLGGARRAEGSPR